MRPDNFRIVFVDPLQELCDELERYFSDSDGVSIVCDKFEALAEFDCMVSAANSFGLMDGGVDLAITEYFGYELMDRVQEMVIERFRGEQPIGTSVIVETGHAKHPFIAHTPTMRVPMSIADTENVYNAMWALLLAVWEHNKISATKIELIACPGLGTLTGQVPCREAARQMYVAYENFRAPPTSISWEFAEHRQASIHPPSHPRPLVPE
jgi:O-acetyl-ADP-ribose deacetylase (regulator of RNase III)